MATTAALATRMKRCVAALLEESAQGSKEIKDDNQNLHLLCSLVEELLTTGIKTKSSLIPGNNRGDYWFYLIACFGEATSVVKKVNSLNTNKTARGKARCFIRESLRAKVLGEHLQV